MAKAKRDEPEQPKEAHPVAALHAAVSGAGEKVKELAPGLTFDKILSDIGSELSRLGVQGSAELASALFGSGAYVPYGRGQNPIDKGLDGEERKPSGMEHGGMEM
jgi:hypothetical protein